MSIQTITPKIIKNPTQDTIKRQQVELKRFADSQFKGKSLVDVARLIQNIDRKLLKRLYPAFSKGIGVYGLVESGAREYVRQKYPQEAIKKGIISKSVIKKRKQKLRKKAGKYKKTGKFTSKRISRAGYAIYQWAYPYNLWNPRTNDFNKSEYNLMESYLVKEKQVWQLNDASPSSFQFVYFVVKYVEFTLEFNGKKWLKGKNSVKRYGLVKIVSPKGTVTNQFTLMVLQKEGALEVYRFKKRDVPSVKRQIFNVKIRVKKVI